MYDIIVLGLIPGTQIQITFFVWLFVAASALIVITGWRAHRARLATIWLVTLSLLLVTRRSPQL